MFFVVTKTLPHRKLRVFPELHDIQLHNRTMFDCVTYMSNYSGSHIHL